MLRARPDSNREETQGQEDKHVCGNVEKGESGHVRGCSRLSCSDFVSAISRPSAHVSVHGCVLPECICRLCVPAYIQCAILCCTPTSVFVWMTVSLCI